MRKTFLIAGVALLATVASCDLLKNTFKEQDVKVNESSNVASADFFGLKDSPVAAANPQGDLSVVISADEPIKAVVDLSQDQTLIDGSLKFDGNLLPDIAKPMNDVAPDNAGILFLVKNPSAKDIKLSAKLVVDDGKPVQLPSFRVPANSDYKIILVKQELTDPILQDTPSQEVPDEAIAVPELNTIGLGKPFVSMKLCDLVVSSGKTKAAAPAGESVELAINAKFCSLLSFPKNTVITIHRSFHDLKVNLDRLSEYTYNKYAITLIVTNTIPFEIEASASNSDGVTAVSDKPVKAGTRSNPVETTAMITVTDNSGHKVSEIANADLTLKLTAAVNGAKIPKEAKIKIEVDNITPLE